MIFATNENEIEEKHENKVLYFYATWMPFHKKMMIMIEKIENKNKNIHFIAVDVDHFKSSVIRYSVESIPTIILFNKNKQLKRITGLVLTSAFNSFFNDI
jgi:thiol-disulfide isomerase/thioredoxin